MDYSSMKVADLKELAALRGVKLAQGARKADIIAALEEAEAPIEVSASVVDGEIAPIKAFDIDMSVVQDDISVLTKAIDGALAVYGDVMVDDEVLEDMSGGDIAICESQLADALKAADDARLKLGRDYRKPLDTANARYKELIGPAEEQLAKFAERRKDLRYMGLRGTYESCCASNGFANLPDVVPFDRLLKDHPQWMARNTNAGKAAEKVEDETMRIIRDWHTLKSQQASMRFYVEAEARFFEELDVAKAIDFNNRREDEQRRIDALEAERQANEMARRDAEARLYAQQQVAQAAQMLEPQPEQVPVQKQYRYVFDVTAPQAQAEIKALFSGVGIHGKLAEVAPDCQNIVTLIKGGQLAPLGVVEIQKGVM